MPGGGVPHNPPLSPRTLNVHIYSNVPFLIPSPLLLAVICIFVDRDPAPPHCAGLGAVPTSTLTSLASRVPKFSPVPPTSPTSQMLPSNLVAGSDYDDPINLLPRKRGGRNPLIARQLSPQAAAPNKRLKSNNHSTTVKSDPDLPDILTDQITDFNLCVNELFQLKEYGSLVEWVPSDFSKAYKQEVPEIFEYFIKNNKFELHWDNEGVQGLDSLPLRLQKKKLAEREAELLQRYPFMDTVKKQSLEQELYLLLQPDEQKPMPAKAAPKTKLKPKTKPKQEPLEKFGEVAIEEFLPLDISEDFDSETEYNTHYKVKTISHTLPAPIVTHPSHIPSWRPIEGGTGLQAAGDILEFDPEPIKIKLDREGHTQIPVVEAKLKRFLDQKFKAGIIDDSGAEVANSPEEYASVLSQQLSLLEKLRHKILVEDRFELNGDKVEQRKVILPNASNKTSLDLFRDNGSILPKIQGATNDATFQDHMVSQGMAFARIHQGVRRQHQARIRRISQIVEQHFRKKAGEKERLAREREQNLRRISRVAIQAVRKRWSQAHKVHKYLQHEKEEELKQIEGREHLSKMLEHSTQLLEAQLNKSSRDDTEAESATNDSSDDSENFSSSSDSDDDLSKDVETDAPDSDLTVDELKRKYAKLENLSSQVSDTNVSESAEESDDEAGSTLAAFYDPKTLTTPEISSGYSDAQIKIIEAAANGKPDGVLDSDDASDSMDEESVTSMESDTSGSDVDDDDAENGADLEASAIASLYGNNGTDKKPSSNGLLSTQASDHDLPMDKINGLEVRDVPLPSLLRGTLRPYQKQGLNWLASLYNNDTNGILADEMGLGKTIQTISLLAYLACEHHIWGPHLIIVPTSVMLNWEMEFKKFAPGFRVMTYYGSPQERARKRKGWNKEDAFHVCITSYQLVVHDHSSFKRKKWRYMILDEAHNIKNFRSTRWKALLNFNTENRLLLTGTPLQNNLMELWSLLYFLMPSSKVEQMMPEGFANFEDFQQWFGKPVDKILEQTATGDIIDETVISKLDNETKNTVARLHQVLRPYLLRRLKKDVEKQMPGKYEHIIYCRLSNRQRYLYDDFMSRAKTKETLASGNFLSIINCLMQLRKVCNHPDLFEVRPIVTSYAMERSVSSSFTERDSMIRNMLAVGKDELSLGVLNLDVTNADHMNYFAAQSNLELMSNKELGEQIAVLDELISKGADVEKAMQDGSAIGNMLQVNRHLKLEQQVQLRNQLKQLVYLNTLRCLRKPLIGESALQTLSGIYKTKTLPDNAKDLIMDVDQRCESMADTVEKYAVITPAVVALNMKDQVVPLETQLCVRNSIQDEAITNPYHQAQVKLSIAFPDKQLLQYDCGKLQKLATLLQQLVPNGHRALIFTQMTKVLDILEQFLNLHGYRYMRLDGATKIEDRQLLTEKFNRDPKIPVFILSTRSGGLGINLTGADTVIFYDSDWNPAMDKQCQDRCHRIGQMRDVHIYRFVSEYTIESNILKKANQKRQLDNVVIQEGDFTTDYLGKFSVRDLVNDTSIISDLPDKPIGDGMDMNLLAQAEDEADRNAAKEAMKEVTVDDEDFNEDSKHGTPGPGARDASDTNDMDYDEGVGHIDEYMLRYMAEGFYVE